MDERKDPPIDPLEYLHGTTVVDFGDLRIARGLSRRPYTGCKHRNLRYDSRERRIWCSDCERDVEHFDAFLAITENYDATIKQAQEMHKEAKEAQSFALRSIASKEMDRIWRSRNMVPACPHCGLGIFPEHVKRGLTTLGRDYATAAIKRAKPGSDR